MKALRIVPIPGFCLSGIHMNNTNMLITKVEKPIDQSVRFEIPWANTVYGPTPAPLVIKRLSPRPNKNNPNTKNIKVSGLGLRLNESSELQATLGIVLIVKVSEKSFMDH
jgi:hypothetical protein